MIGFFEQQYLEFKKRHLRNLVALAMVDGHLHDDEVDLIYLFGNKYGLKDSQIASILDDRDTLKVELPEDPGQQLNQLYDLIMMTYADGVIDEKEVEFCQQLATNMGFNSTIIDQLLDLFKSGEPEIEEWYLFKQHVLDKDYSPNSK